VALAAFCAVLAVGCPIPDPAPPDPVPTPPVSPPKYYSGIQASDALCDRCHKEYEPEHFTDEEWQAFLPGHCRLDAVKVDPETMQLILDYLTRYN